MFYEVHGLHPRRTEIAWVTSKDGFVCTHQEIILRESSHLSCPYVFHWHGRYYMIPETHQADSLCLYEARFFSTKWECAETLIHDQRLTDSSIVDHHDHWWLFGETSPTLAHDMLRFYHAPDLRDPWKEHPRSPVIQANPYLARPAGRIVLVGDRIRRFAQGCFPVDGTKVRALEIVELTPLAYGEQPASLDPLLALIRRLSAQELIHLFDSHRLDSHQWIAAGDGWRQDGGPIPEGWRRTIC